MVVKRTDTEAVSRRPRHGLSGPGEVWPSAPDSKAWNVPLTRAICASGATCLHPGKPWCPGLGLGAQACRPCAGLLVSGPGSVSPALWVVTGQLC